MRRLIYLLPLVVFAAVGIYFFFGLQRDPKMIPSALIDKPVPEFTLAALPGRDRGLVSADLKGSVQLVNVFASWCVPCRVEHPLLMQLAKEGTVPIRAINYKDKPEDALAWLKRHGDPYTAIGVDLDGRVGIDWGVYGVPETFLVDRDGRIRYKHVGPLTPDDLERKILPMIRELKG